MNVLICTLDTLRSQSMSLYGYNKLTTPHIDKFAKKGVVFNECYSPVIPTEPAHTSIFTGRDAYAHEIIAHDGIASLSEDIPMMAEIFKKNGYYTGAVDIMGSPWFKRGFDDYLQSIWETDPKSHMRKAEGVNECAFELFENAKSKDKPFFIWLHYWDPHNPYKAPEPFPSMYYSFGNEKDPDNHSLDGLWECDPFKEYFSSWMGGITDVNHPIAQYDAEISYMDCCLEHLWRRLEKMGLMEDTLVILVADHGEELDEHELWFDHHGLYDTNLWIPLIFHFPKKLPQGKRINGIVQPADVAPTVYEIIGLKEGVSGIEMEGQSLLSAMRDDKKIEDRDLYLMECTWMKKRGVRTRDWKYIVEGGGTPEVYNTPEVELYDLKKDPEEKVNLADKLKDVVKKLEKQLQDHIEKRKEETGKPDPFEYQEVTCIKNSFPDGLIPVTIKNLSNEEKSKIAARLRGMGYGG